MSCPATTTLTFKPEPILQVTCERVEREGYDTLAYLARIEDWSIVGWAPTCFSEALRALTEHQPTMHPHEWADNTYQQLKTKRLLEKQEKLAGKRK